MLTHAGANYSRVTPILAILPGSLMKAYFSGSLPGQNEHNLTYTEDVAPAKALEYAKNLWEDNFTAKTYNAHLAHLSRIFSTRDAVNPLWDKFPHRKSVGIGISIVSYWKNGTYRINTVIVQLFENIDAVCFTGF